jgi:hypothetical protein
VPLSRLGRPTRLSNSGRADPGPPDPGAGLCLFGGTETERAAIIVLR